MRTRPNRPRPGEPDDTPQDWRALAEHIRTTTPAYYGTDEDETMIGTRFSEAVCGEGGNDIVKGLGGNDLIDGCHGDDVLYGGAGSDGFWFYWNHGSHDVVMDFKHGEDFLWLNFPGVTWDDITIETVGTRRNPAQIVTIEGYDDFSVTVLGRGLDLSDFLFG
jgi:hypothetical protein